MPNEKRFARIPVTVLDDEQLTPTDKLVYARLALLCWGGNIALVSQRSLSKAAHMDRRNLKRSLDNLARRGHISRAVGRMSRKTVFQLNSPVFLADADQRLVRQPAGLPVRMKPTLQ